MIRARLIFFFQEGLGERWYSEALYLRRRSPAGFTIPQQRAQLKSGAKTDFAMSVNSHDSTSDRCMGKCRKTSTLHGCSTRASPNPKLRYASALKLMAEDPDIEI